MLITLQVEKLGLLEGEDGGEMAMFSEVDYRVIGKVVRGVVGEVYREDGRLEEWLDPWGVQVYLGERWEGVFREGFVRVRNKGRDLRHGFAGNGTIDPRLLSVGEGSASVSYNLGMSLNL